MHLKLMTTVAVFGVAGAGFIGCSKTPSNTTTPANKVTSDAHAHDGWWCDEHGVPEEVCALCDAELVDKFKAKGDWCKQHDRPDSQCFACHPEKEAEFAALYEQKYGKKPPAPTDNEAHDHAPGDKS